MRSLRRAAPTMRPISGCDPDTANAVARAWAGLTSAHTITSRRYSVWGLLRRHVDAPFRQFLLTYQGDWDSRHLAGFAPSLAWKAPTDAARAYAAEDPAASSILRKSLRESSSRADEFVLAIEQWCECLRLSARSAEATQEPQQLLATLDTVRELLTALRRFRPEYGVTANGEMLADAVSRDAQHTFCELCWRESLRTKALRNAPKPSVSKLSSRFCRIHDPRDPKSRYRSDLRYRNAFVKELDALLGLHDSSYLVGFQPPRSADEQEIRKTAYDLVHARLRPLGSSRPGQRERIAELAREGLSQAEISRRLGVSRQAVSKGLQSLKQLMHARLLDAELSPRTGESLNLSGDSGAAIARLVEELSSSALTPCQIARKLGRSRHSLECLLHQS